MARYVYFDASNVASARHLNGPELMVLRGFVGRWKAMFPEDIVVVVAERSLHGGFKYLAPNKETDFPEYVEAVNAGEILELAENREADVSILDWASQFIDAVVVSNDEFKDHRRDFPWIQGNATRFYGFEALTLADGSIQYSLTRRTMDILNEDEIDAAIQKKRMEREEKRERKSRERQERRHGTEHGSGSSQWRRTEWDRTEGEPPPNFQERAGQERNWDEGTRGGPSNAHVSYASFVQRFVARLIDASCVMFLVFALILPIGLYRQYGPCPQEANSSEFDTACDPASLNLVTAIIVGWFLFPAARHFVGRTPGRAIMGIRLVQDGGTPDKGGKAPNPAQGLLRALVSVVSYWPFLFGYLWALGDEKGRTWHDLAANTLVVRTR